MQASVNKLFNTVKNIAKANAAPNTTLVWGVVTSIDPLSVKINDRLTITEEFLILSALCQEAIIKIPTELIVEHLHTIPLHYTAEAAGHIHPVLPFVSEVAMPEIRLWRGLVIGDNVRMLKINEGQTYFILEREEGIPWYPVTTITDNT